MLHFTGSVRSLRAEGSFGCGDSGPIVALSELVASSFIRTTSFEINCGADDECKAVRWRLKGAAESNSFEPQQN